MLTKSEKGMITLEACVSVLSFLLLMLLLSGLFVMFMAQNITAHVALQTSQSLSLDVFSTERMTAEADDAPEVKDAVQSLVKGLFGDAQDSPYFVTDDRWYEGDETTVSAAVKQRFIGYLTAGDEAKADELLKQMNVINGLEGLDFSESHVLDDTLYIILKYKLEYDFNIWNVGDVEVVQTTCSKLWK